MAILLCEVPLNKDTERERGREIEATAAVELQVHSTQHTKSICAEVVGNECCLHKHFVVAAEK